MSADAERIPSESTPEELGGDNMATIRKKSMTSSAKLNNSSGGKGGNSTSAARHAQQQVLENDSGGEDNYNSDSELSDIERNFLTKGAFLLTPSNELTLEKAGAICEKMNFRGPFSLTKTATGILFKFAEPDDCTAVYKKGFHKVTGARFYKKISIPCRPMRTFVVYALDVPETVPVEDIRHALFKFQSVVEVSRMVTPGSPTPTTPGTGGPSSILTSTTAPSTDKSPTVGTAGPGGSPILPVSVAATNNAVAGYCPLVRITLGSQEEANMLLQNGLDFYGATFFPTESARPTKKISTGSQPGKMEIGAKIRELLPVFDATGFSKIPAPAERMIKPR